MCETKIDKVYSPMVARRRQVSKILDSRCPCVLRSGRRYSLFMPGVLGSKAARQNSYITQTWGMYGIIALTCNETRSLDHSWLLKYKYYAAKYRRERERENDYSNWQLTRGTAQLYITVSSSIHPKTIASHNYIPIGSTNTEAQRRKAVWGLKLMQ